MGHGLILNREILDKNEAANLFENVRTPTPAEVELADQFSRVIEDYDEGAIVLLLSGEEFLGLLHTQEEAQQEEAQQEEGDIEGATHSEDSEG